MHESWEFPPSPLAAYAYLGPLARGRRVLVVTAASAEPGLEQLVPAAAAVHLLALSAEHSVDLLLNWAGRGVEVHAETLDEWRPDRGQDPELIVALDLLARSPDPQAALARCRELAGERGLLVTRSPSPDAADVEDSAPCRELSRAVAIDWLREHFAEVGLVREAAAGAILFGVPAEATVTPAGAWAAEDDRGGALLFASARALPELPDRVVLGNPSERAAHRETLARYRQRLDDQVRELRALQLERTRTQADRARLEQELKAVTSTVHSSVAELGQEVSASGQALRETLGKLERRDRELAQHRDRLQRLVQQLADEGLAIADGDLVPTAEAQAQREAATEERRQLATRAAEAEDLAARLAEVESRRAQTEAALTDLQTRLREQEARAEQLETASRSLRQTQESLADSLAHHGMRLAGGRVEPTPERRQRDREERRQRQALEARLAEATAELAQLREALQHLTARVGTTTWEGQARQDELLREAEARGREQATAELAEARAQAAAELAEAQPQAATSPAATATPPAPERAPDTPAQEAGAPAGPDPQRVEALRRALAAERRQIREARHFLDELERSKRWKAGNLIGETFRTVTGKGEISTGVTELRSTLDQLTRSEQRLEAAIDTLDVEAATAASVPATAPAEPPSALLPRPEVQLPRPPRERAGSRVEVVVCVHDARREVKACLDSVYRTTGPGVRLIVVDDGSKAPTGKYLAELAAARDDLELLVNDTARGYTRAANQGLDASRADVVVLLNSDTVVPPGWLDRLVDCLDRDPRIGIAGPLSNAATYQSVPAVRDDTGEWATNPLPAGYSVDAYAEVVAAVSDRRAPRVGLLNGFCLAIKREVLNAVGRFDEDAFPQGFGEENDYCLRAAAAGFDLAVADDAYVFHAKSRSYTHARRKKLSAAGAEALREKHSVEAIEAATATVRSDADLEVVRERLRAVLDGGLPVEEIERAPRVLFVAPFFAVGGGIHSIIQDSTGMRELGADARVAVPAKHRVRYREAYPRVAENGFLFYDSEADLVRRAGEFDVAVATLFTSVRLVRDACAAHPHLVAAYYIQDYEPWFSEPGSALEQEALASYTGLDDLVRFAKTDWLGRVVEERHGVTVHKVAPSLDREVFNLAEAAGKRRRKGPVVVTAMIRVRTPRRAPRETMQVLQSLHESFGEGVAIHIFGTAAREQKFKELPRDFAFENHGVITRDEVAGLLRASDVFLDLSTYQAFGRTGLEAMACGCATVLPAECGTSEYAEHGTNALLVDTGDFAAMVGAAAELVRDGRLRARLIRNAKATAERYSVNGAAASELALLRPAVIRRRVRAVLARHVAATAPATPAPAPRAASDEARDTLQQDLARYVSLVERLEYYLDEIERSKRWRVGNLIGEAYRTVTRRPEVSTGLEELRRTLGEMADRRESLQARLGELDEG